MTTPPVPNIPGAAVMTDTLDFVKNLWGSMGVPGMGSPGSAGIPGIPGIPGITVPSLSVEDLDKKIADLKAVEAWLNINMSMLRATIQGLEVQRGTMATLKSLGASFAAAVKQPQTAEKSLWESPYASAFFHHAKTPAPAEPLPTAAAAVADKAQNPGASSATAQMANPAVWWNMLQEQFKQAVNSTMSPEAVASATAMASEAAAQFAAAAGGKPGTGKSAGAPVSDDAPGAGNKPARTGKS